MRESVHPGRHARSPAPPPIRQVRGQGSPCRASLIPTQGRGPPVGSLAWSWRWQWLLARGWRKGPRRAPSKTPAWRGRYLASQGLKPKEPDLLAPTPRRGSNCTKRCEMLTANCTQPHRSGGCLQTGDLYEGRQGMDGCSVRPCLTPVGARKWAVKHGPR